MPSHERRDEAPAADERGRRRDPEHAARAERRVQVAGAGAAEVEQRDREHDEEDVERPDRDDCAASKPEQQPRLRFLSHEPQARGGVAVLYRAAAPAEALRPARPRARAASERPAITANTVAGAADREQDARRRRGRERG